MLLQVLEPAPVELPPDVLDFLGCRTCLLHPLQECQSWDVARDERAQFLLGLPFCLLFTQSVKQHHAKAVFVLNTTFITEAIRAVGLHVEPTEYLNDLHAVVQSKRRYPLLLELDREVAIDLIQILPENDLADPLLSDLRSTSPLPILLLLALSELGYDFFLPHQSPILPHLHLLFNGTTVPSICHFKLTTLLLNLESL